MALSSLVAEISTRQVHTTLNISTCSNKSACQRLINKKKWPVTVLVTDCKNNLYCAGDDISNQNLWQHFFHTTYVLMVQRDSLACGNICPQFMTILCWIWSLSREGLLSIKHVVCAHSVEVHYTGKYSRRKSMFMLRRGLCLVQCMLRTELTVTALRISWIWMAVAYSLWQKSNENSMSRASLQFWAFWSDIAYLQVWEIKLERYMCIGFEFIQKKDIGFEFIQKLI